MELCDVILRTNRVRCALNMEILDLLRMFEKVSRSLKYDSNIFFDQKHLLASERSERDTLRSVQLRIVYIYIMVRANFVLITRKEGGA